MNKFRAIRLPIQMRFRWFVWMGWWGRCIDSLREIGMRYSVGRMQGNVCVRGY